MDAPAAWRSAYLKPFEDPQLACALSRCEAHHQVPAWYAAHKANRRIGCAETSLAMLAPTADRLGGMCAHAIAHAENFE